MKKLSKPQKESKALVRCYDGEGGWQATVGAVAAAVGAAAAVYVAVKH